jgi:hypothetical protein
VDGGVSPVVRVSLAGAASPRDKARVDRQRVVRLRGALRLAEPCTRSTKQASPPTAITGRSRSSPSATSNLAHGLDPGIRYVVEPREHGCRLPADMSIGCSTAIASRAWWASTRAVRHCAGLLLRHPELAQFCVR